MMKQSFLVLLLIVFIGLCGYQLARPYYTEMLGEFENPLEENAQLAERERQMLADPATGKIPEGVSFKEIAYLHEMQQSSLMLNKKTRGDNWVSRGPWNVGGRTRGFCIDITNENHLIAGGVSGGIWQSFDAGNTWSRQDNVNGHPGVISISQDTRPGKTNIWYALSGEIYGTSAGATGAFYLGDGASRSVDNGSTWKPIASTAGAVPSAFSAYYEGAWRIATSPIDTFTGCLYMATYGAIYRSIDTGKSWSTVIKNTASYFTDVKVASNGVVYASMSTDAQGTLKGFFRSADGKTFKNITPSFLKGANRSVIEINPNNENEVYFLSELPADSLGGVITANYEGKKEFVSLVRYRYISGDGTGSGGEWTNLSSNLPVNASSPFDRFNSQGGYDLFVRMQPGSNTLFIGGTNIYRSTDAFTTPNNISQIGGYGLQTTLPFFTVYLNHHPDQHDLYFLKSDPHKAYSISDGGVRFTENIDAPVVEWQNKNFGYVTSQLYSVAIDETNASDRWMIGGFQDNGNYVSNSNDPTHNWVLPMNGDGAYNYISPDKSFVVMSIQQGRVMKAQLDKHGYLLARRRIDPAPFVKENYDFINPFIVDPNNNNLLYMPIGKKLARLNNLASIPVNNNYDQLKTGWDIFSDTIKTPNLVTSSSSTPAFISTLAVSKNSPNILYLGTSNRQMFRIDRANIGSPSMVLLDTSSTPVLPAGGYVSDIAIDPDSAKNVLICYSNYNIQSLFYSNDSGNHWFYVGGNLEGSNNSSSTNPSIRCVKILAGANGKRTYFAGTSIGLFSTDKLVLSTSPPFAGDSSTNWKQESPDKIGAAVVTDIKIRQVDSYIAIATHGNGVFESYYEESSPRPIISSFPEISVYPNPASDKIYFSFDATGTTNVRAEIYDISGRRIESLRSGMNYNEVFTQVLDVSRYHVGHYFITFYTDDKHKQMRHFIVKH